MINMLLSVEYVKMVCADNRRGYSQSRREEALEDDCSSLSLDSLEFAGVNIGSATYTGNALVPLLAAGFVDVTHTINLVTGAGLKTADVLLRPKTASRNGHMAIMVSDTQLGQAAGDLDGVRGDSSGKELYIRNYAGAFNPVPQYVLRYTDVSVDKVLFAIKVVEDTWTHRSPDGNESSRFDIVNANQNLILGISEVRGNWGRIQNQASLWISVNPNYTGVVRITDTPVAPPIVTCPYPEPKTLYKNGITFRGSDARWYEWHLIRAGYDCGCTSNLDAHGTDGVAGSKVWTAINAVQEKGAIGAGNAGSLTRALVSKL